VLLPCDIASAVHLALLQNVQWHSQDIATDGTMLHQLMRTVGKQRALVAVDDALVAYVVVAA
jgi:hypothetical protein